MGQPGFEVMIGMLSEDKEAIEAIKFSLGKKIKKVWIEDNELKFIFSDDSKLKLWDNGQLCSEYRYISCDDNLDEFVGETFLDIALKDAPDIDDGAGPHEVQFLEIRTDRGSFHCANHNEHNGCYSGFRIVASNG